MDVLDSAERSNFDLKCRGCYYRSYLEARNDCSVLISGFESPTVYPLIRVNPRLAVDFANTVADSNRFDFRYFLGETGKRGGQSRARNADEERIS